LAALDQWIARQSDMPSRPEAVRRLLVLGLTVEQNVAEIVACGRTRWKIENEGFNVMKNDGYEFEHNFSHGARFLAMRLASLNILAFA
jgi:hypothetical protein